MKPGPGTVGLTTTNAAQSDLNDGRLFAIAIDQSSLSYQCSGTDSLWSEKHLNNSITHAEVKGMP
jgi:hypothetical protein